MGAVGYAAINSSVDTALPREQLVSLLTMFLVLAVFILKRFRFGLLSVIGYVSFEIYLVHWPLISRYDFLYTHTPAWLATALYLGIFVALGWLLKSITNLFFALFKKSL
jgi:peptidoglycan/LPS O-acetylase OafA/YrhL